jgi:alanine-glyoxylate transaminase / serine-glyoxylate transaminase / serine-pyruvate transaminase
MCLTALAVAELSLRAAGAKVELGSGVAAAQAVYEQDARVVALAAE